MLASRNWNFKLLLGKFGIKSYSGALVSAGNLFGWLLTIP
jgi:hypothetical protein